METYTLDEICYLDLKTWTWSRSWTFVARFDHSTWIWGGRIWVFGGLGPDMVCEIQRPSCLVPKWWTMSSLEINKFFHSLEMPCLLS